MAAAADVVTLADSVVAVLAAFDWGQTANVRRAWLDTSEIKSLSTLTVLVFPESDVSTSSTRGRYKNELQVQILVQKRVGANFLDADVDAIVGKIAAARDLLRQPLVAVRDVAGNPVANGFPLPPEWPVVSSPESLHEMGLFMSVIVMRWATL